MKTRLLFFFGLFIVCSASFTSCIDKDVRKGQKIAKQRAKATKNHAARHRNHKKLAH